MNTFNPLGIDMKDRSIEQILPLHLTSNFTEELQHKKIVCLVDGEHYPPVTKATLKVLEKKGADIIALVFLGGTEKIKNPVEELTDDTEVKKKKIYIGSKKEKEDLTEKAVIEEKPELVIDLSDEPIVNYEDRFKIASIILKHGAIYMGSDFKFEPPEEKKILDKPSISIIGTGKRVGKTGVSVSIARMMKKEGDDPVIVCMGRGGPEEPVFIDTSEREVDADMLIEIAESGKHAASDYLEDALLAAVPTVGCRRCGGGMAGNPFSSNVAAGAERANKTGEKFVIMEGSGSTLPPVKTDSRIVVIGASQPLDHILKYFGRYRIETSDLVIVTMCEEPIASQEKINDIEKGLKDMRPEVDYLLTKFRPNPLGNVSGKKVFVASTAPEKIMVKIKEYVEKKFDCKVVGMTNNLSNRVKLKEDLSQGLDEAEVLLTEIKAASIDVAGMYAKRKGLEIVFMHNESIVVGGNVESLEKAILDLCEGVLADLEEKT